MGQFKSMETTGAIRPRQQEALPDFCRAMGETLADLVRQLSPSISLRDVAELPILTLGQQFQGGQNNRIGQQAIDDVFIAIVEVVRDYIVRHDTRKLTIRNASGRQVFISLASDPDVRIEEEFSGSLRRKVAIEVKGGTDKSNAHNRAGEELISEGVENS